MNGKETGECWLSVKEMKEGMKVRVKRKTVEKTVLILLFLSLTFTLLLGVSITGEFVMGNDNNISNNTVLARVNISNTEPSITSVRVDDDILSPPNTIDLLPFAPKVVTCNATVFDFNGYQDIVDSSTVYAFFYMDSIGYNAQDDNNTHYTNSSCGSCRQATAAEAAADGLDVSTAALCDCKFAVQYYANSSSEWLCNITVLDSGGTQTPPLEINLSNNASSSFTTITELLAINTSTLIDYGNLSVTETSSEIVHNVTNAGNIPLNITLRGYGGTNESLGSNHTMLCELGNMSIGQQRYAFGTDQVGTTSFDTMTNLTNQTVQTGFNLGHRINDSEFGADRNSTIWRLEVPLTVGGICNGTIIFGAIEDTS